MPMHCVASIQPGCTKKCGNDRCWWRQRDVHGRSPWWYNAPADDYGKLIHDAEQEAIGETYGQPYFPPMTASVGTNVIYVSCDHHVKLGEPVPDWIHREADEANRPWQLGIGVVPGDPITIKVHETVVCTTPGCRTNTKTVNSNYCKRCRKLMDEHARRGEDSSA